MRAMALRASLVVLAALLIVWQASRWAEVGFFINGSSVDAATHVRIDGGCLLISTPVLGGSPVPLAVRFHKWASWRWTWQHQQSGLWYAEDSRLLHSDDFVIPVWMPILVWMAACSPLWCLVLQAAWRRHLGLCVACGYDRRGLPADAKCPECGTVPALPSK